MRASVSPLDRDRCFATGFEQREMSALPLHTHPPAVRRLDLRQGFRSLH